MPQRDFEEARHSIETSDLIHDALSQRFRAHRHARASEPFAVGIRRVRADRHPMARSCFDSRRHDFRVTRMEAARDVGAGDVCEERLVIAFDARPVGLADIGVKIDTHLRRFP
jgi:hypothetical protein